MRIATNKFHSERISQLAHNVNRKGIVDGMRASKRKQPHRIYTHRERERERERERGKKEIKTLHAIN